MIATGNTLALLMTGYVRLRNGKMGFGLLRYSENPIACVIASDEVGEDLRALTGIDTDVPIVATVDEARALGADTMVIAVATSGGILPDGYRGQILEALHHGMSIVNGLHGRYAEDPDYRAAKHADAFIWDVRQEPAGLVSGRGRARSTAARRVLTVGTDMAIGKMTASLELDRLARARGLRSKFIATGQIGICISGDGVALDAVRVDFASGAIESLCLKYGNDHDVLWVEGQGSAVHPGSTAWVPLLRGSSATDMILVHRAGQVALDGLEDVTLPPLPDVIALYEAAASISPSYPAARVRGIALNCAKLAPSEIDAACAAVEAQTGLPCVDVVHHGPARLLDALAIEPLARRQLA
jgi:uncharacterized NAD-dependent epimerase/dehydratase family protein